MLFRYKCILRLLINVELLSNMLAITSNKWNSPKFKSNFNIYKEVTNEKMRGVKKRDIIWNTSRIWGTIINNIKNKVQIYFFI